MRKSVGTMTGCLLVNGKPATSSFVRQTSYAPQVRPCVSMIYFCFGRICRRGQDRYAHFMAAQCKCMLHIYILPCGQKPWLGVHA